MWIRDVGLTINAKQAEIVQIMNADTADFKALNTKVSKIVEMDLPTLKRLTNTHTYLGVHIKSMMDGVEFQ